MFGVSFDLHFINYEMAPDFSWSKDFISKISRTPEVAAYPGANLWSQLDQQQKQLMQHVK